MKFVSSTAVIVVLAATAVWAQSAVPVPLSTGTGVTSGRPMVRGRGVSPAAIGKTSGAPTPSLRQRMEDMQATLNKMHALLTQMRAKAASSSSKDSLAKANLDMWELMLSHLDKQFDQLRIATLTREDFESRRAAMYKQADTKAAAEAASHAAAQGSGTAPAPATGSTASGSEGAKTGQVAPSATGGPSPAQPPAPDSTLPK